MKARVQDLLGLSYEHFTQSVLLPQGGFSEFLRATSANRQRLLVELLAFGVYKEIGQRARERADNAKNRCDLAQQSREELRDATPEAESAAAARLADLTALADKVESSLATLTELHKQSEDAAQLVKAEGTAATQLAAVRTPAEVPGLAQQIAAADALVASGRKRRDQAAQAAAETEEARSRLPDKASTQRFLEMHVLRRDLLAEAEKQAQALAVSRQNEATLAAQLQAADLAAAQAQDAVEAARRAHAAAGLAETLHVGDDCPVCQQKVAILPAHVAPADVSAAQAALQAATAAQRTARSAHQETARATASAQSALDGTRTRLDKAAEVMADAPAEAELTRRSSRRSPRPTTRSPGPARRHLPARQSWRPPRSRAKPFRLTSSGPGRRSPSPGTSWSLSARRLSRRAPGRTWQQPG